MQRLQRSYFFEFAGMPQSGKTVVKDILFHYLKRMEYPFREFNGGSRQGSTLLPIYQMTIEELNQELAKDILRFLRSNVESADQDHKIYLLDRGLIDRCIFTDALFRDGKVSQEQASVIYQALTMPELLARLDGVFIFVTSPSTALAREFADKLVSLKSVRSQGYVMNDHFLGKMLEAAKSWYKQISGQGNRTVHFSELIDTTKQDTDMQDVARSISQDIQERYPELEFEIHPAR